MEQEEFNLEEKYKEAENCMTWEKGTDIDNDIKSSLKKYRELNCPNGTAILDWLFWNAEQNIKEAQTRLKNGEDPNLIINDFKDRTKNQFHY